VLWPHASRPGISLLRKDSCHFMFFLVVLLSNGERQSCPTYVYLRTTPGINWEPLDWLRNQAKKMWYFIQL
jgi:hypothetical protein